MIFISFSRILPLRPLYNILKDKKFDEEDKGGRGSRNVVDINQIYCNLFIYFILFHLHFMCFIVLLIFRIVCIRIFASYLKILRLFHPLVIRSYKI